MIQIADKKLNVFLVEQSLKHIIKFVNFYKRKRDTKSRNNDDDNVGIQNN